MAGSLDNLYPSGNWQLFDEISHTGLLLSEMAPGSKPTRWRFLQRNRLIAALSEAVVVTEAGWRSGSINTASHANALNRRVFAVPGPINSPSSAGCNRLIRDQLAELLLDAADLPLELGWREPSIPDQSSLGSLELRALDALTTREQPFETIAIASGLSRAELTLALGGLQIAQLALRGEGNGWLRTH
jgi:DNA processing protein